MKTTSTRRDNFLEPHYSVTRPTTFTTTQLPLVLEGLALSKPEGQKFLRCQLSKYGRKKVTPKKNGSLCTGTFHQLLHVGWNGTSCFFHDSCNANSFEGIFTWIVNRFEVIQKAQWKQNWEDHYHQYLRPKNVYERVTSSSLTFGKHSETLRVEMIPVAW